MDRIKKLLAQNHNRDRKYYHDLAKIYLDIKKLAEVLKAGTEFEMEFAANKLIDRLQEFEDVFLKLLLAQRKG